MKRHVGVTYAILKTILISIYEVPKKFKEGYIHGIKLDNCGSISFSYALPFYLSVAY